MKILFINSVCGIGSTGRICTTMAQEYESQGHEVKIAYGRAENVPEQYKEYAVRIGKTIDMKLHAVRTRILDEHGLGSIQATRNFLKWADDYNPDLLWLHNIHGYYINYELLFAWIKSRPNMQVKWTLHDCWAFTGHCSHFSYVKCNQWQTHCSHCPQTRRYPGSYGKDNCKANFDRKRAAFTGVKNMTLITPSQWLADLTRQSFLKEYPVEVHYNTIDTNVFKPTPSDFRERYGLKDKFIVLGVANVWHERKGLNDFLKLAEMLDDRYAIVLVGLSKKQIKELPRNIRGIQRTNNPHELAAIYTAADMFVNPSVEETFGMTPIEAKACGTPSIVYKDTACEEVAKINGNKIVPQDINELYKAITGTEFVGGGTKMSICKLVCIPRTNNSQELAAIYTAANVFFNPTYEDNYPTVNLEAEACGTYVVTYDAGGSGETIHMGESTAVKTGDLQNAIRFIKAYENGTYKDEAT